MSANLYGSKFTVFQSNLNRIPAGVPIRIFSSRSQLGASKRSGDGSRTRQGWL